MSYLIVPKEVTGNEANIWLAAINENFESADSALRYGNNLIDLSDNWIRFQTSSGKNSMLYRHLKIQNLQARTDYAVEFINSAGQMLATGSFRTLPNELPTLGQRPFSVLLASCFASSRSDSVLLGSSYLNLQRSEPVDIKILCGDQVYLDDPWDYFLRHTHSFNDLEDLLFAKYVATWTQNKSLTGFRQFLQSGANFFSSDDHEFWNNAPNRATLIRDSWFQSGRENWLRIARNLLEIFQSKESKTTFNVGTLSFFIADTRINRDEDRQNFMWQTDLLALSNWVDNLQGVGIIVVGQPIFSEKAGFFGGRFGDWNLPNYEQYKDFVRILMKSNHSILILTGDVHYGRIARCRIKPGIHLYEIISSPTSLVNQKVGGKWHEAPSMFPVESIPGLVGRMVTNHPEYQMTENHFLTLNFYRDGLKTKVIPKVCEIVGNGRIPRTRAIDTFELF